MSAASEQRCQEAQIDGPILDDKNRGHNLPRISSDARRAPSPFRPIPRQLSVKGIIMPLSCVNTVNEYVTEVSRAEGFGKPWRPPDGARRSGASRRRIKPVNSG